MTKRYLALILFGFILGFGIGWYFGGESANQVLLNKKTTRGTFYSNEGRAKKNLTTEESALYKMIIDHNSSFVNKLSNGDKILAESILKKIRAELDKDRNVRIVYKRILSHDEMDLASRIRKDRSQFIGSLDKEKRFVFRTMLPKLTMEEIVDLYQGVR